MNTISVSSPFRSILPPLCGHTVLHCFNECSLPYCFVQYYFCFDERTILVATFSMLWEGCGCEEYCFFSVTRQLCLNIALLCERSILVNTAFALWFTVLENTGPSLVGAVFLWLCNVSKRFASYFLSTQFWWILSQLCECTIFINTTSRICVHRTFMNTSHVCE